MKFEGIEAFEELGQQASKSMKIAFFPKTGNQKVLWKSAIDDCVKVADKTNEERVELSRLRAETRNTPTPTLNRKRPRRSSIAESPDLIPQNKKMKFDDAEKLIEAIPNDVLEENRRKLKTGFKLYQLGKVSKISNFFQNLLLLSFEKKKMLFFRLSNYNFSF